MEPNQAAAPAHQFTLPVLIFGIVEIRRLGRELEALEDFMRQSSLRQPGTQPTLPKLSRLCESLATENQLNLLLPEHRETMKQFLKAVEQSSPRIHISFAADPSATFTAKVVEWLRQNIHMYTLLEVGLQPVIAAGCMVRTNNKVFDLSLRERFADSEKLLLGALEATAAETAPAQPAPEVTAQ